MTVVILNNNTITAWHSTHCHPDPWLAPLFPWQSCCCCSWWPWAWAPSGRAATGTSPASGAPPPGHASSAARVGATAAGWPSSTATHSATGRSDQSKCWHCECYELWCRTVSSDCCPYYFTHCEGLSLDQGPGYLFQTGDVPENVIRPDNCEYRQVEAGIIVTPYTQLLHPDARCQYHRLASERERHSEKTATSASARWGTKNYGLLSNDCWEGDLDTEKIECSLMKNIECK